MQDCSVTWLVYTVLSNKHDKCLPCVFYSQYMVDIIFPDIRDLGYVLRVLHDAGLAAKWESIGQTLTVPDGELASIKTKFEGDPNLCLLHVIATWLNGQKRSSDPPSWEGLIRMIADPCGGCKRRAALQVAEKFKG